MRRDSNAMGKTNSWHSGLPNEMGKYRLSKLRVTPFLFGCFAIVLIRRKPKVLKSVKYLKKRKKKKKEII